MRKRRTLQFEALEPLTLMSAVPAPVASAASPPPAQIATIPRVSNLIEELHLSGSVRGSYHVQVDESGGVFRLQGVGRVNGIGLARLSAESEANEAGVPEFLDMTLANQRGSVTIRVEPPEPGQAIEPANPNAVRLSYQIVNGSGAFQQAQGAGTVDLGLVPRLRTLGLTGRMSLVFHPEPV